MLDTRITDSAGVSDWLASPYHVGSYAGFEEVFLISFTGIFVPRLIIRGSDGATKRRPKQSTRLQVSLKDGILLVVPGFPRFVICWAGTWMYLSVNHEANAEVA
jgi:hypothetical protein